MDFMFIVVLMICWMLVLLVRFVVEILFFLCMVFVDCVVVVCSMLLKFLVFFGWVFVVVFRFLD